MERWETLTCQEVDSGGRSPVGAAVSGERSPIMEVILDFSGRSQGSQELGLEHSLPGFSVHGILQARILE